MSRPFKEGNGSKEHINEFGECFGEVERPVNYGTQKGPEVDVRWRPSRLRYAYHPKELVIISEEKFKNTVRCTLCNRKSTKWYKAFDLTDEVLVSYCWFHGPRIQWIMSGVYKPISEEEATVLFIMEE